MTGWCSALCCHCVGFSVADCTLAWPAPTATCTACTAEDDGLQFINVALPIPGLEADGLPNTAEW